MSDMPELTPQVFADRWGKSTLSERASAQSHFIDLCNMLGEKTPAEADPNGDFYTFERRVDKVGSGGGKGFADVWYREHFAFEYKGKHKDLSAAYDQLLRYREDLGNPPFLGGNKVRAELEDEYVDDLFRLYKGRVPAFADFVTYWFEKSRKYTESGHVQRVGLLSTNSIRGGKNREVLKRIKQSGDIFFAESDRPWILNGAAVRVSMVGFDDGTQEEYVLDGVPVAQINSDLTGSADITSAKVLAENSDRCFMGPSPKAPFDIEPEIAASMLDAPLNVNGRPNSDVVRPVVSAVDVVRRPRGKFTIDFALLDEENASYYEMPFEYARENVYPVRSKNRRASYAALWWQYAEARPGMRRALTGLSYFIVTPAVAKHRIFVWMPREVLCNQGTLVIARDDDYFFGVLHSRAHEVWSLRMGTSLGVGNDPRYTPTSCFETFPFPWPPGDEPVEDERVKEVSAAARRLDELRRNWLDPEGISAAELKKRTLTNLYNARPTWLQNAHARLDRAVYAAYGWPEDVSDEDILKNLLALNVERSGANVESVKA